MGSEQGKAIRVGAVMALSIVLLGLFIWSVGQKGKLFTRKASFVTTFRNVSGLRVGSDVSLSGYLIGSVTEIDLPESVTHKYISVTLSVDASKVEWIRQDSKARVKTLGLLGDKYVEIAQGSPELPAMPPGSAIPSVESSSLEDVWERGEDAVDNLIVMSSTLRKILTRIEAGDGLLGKLVSDKELGEELVSRARSVAANIDGITGEIEQGHGAVGSLIKDREKGERMVKDLAEFARFLRETADRIDRGEGVAGKLIGGGEGGEKMLHDIEAAAASMRSLAGKLDQGEGMLARLMTDKEYADRVLSDLSRTADATARITSSIADGRGTLGKLVQDEGVYDGLNDILGGMNQSRLTKWMLRRYQEKGHEQRGKTVTEAVPSPTPLP